MSTMVRLVNQAAEIAKENHLTNIHQMVVDVGEMTDILPEYLYKYYPEATKNTLFQGSELKVRVIQTKVRCLDCGTEFHPSKENDYKCPSCHGIRCRVLEGRSVILARIIGEE